MSGFTVGSNPLFYFIPLHRCKFEKGELLYATAAKDKLYTVSEYLAPEGRAKNKHEYYNGKIIKTPAASFVHNQIAINVIASLAMLLYKKNYIVLKPI